MIGAIFSKLLRVINSIIPERIRPAKTFSIHTRCSAMKIDMPYPLNTWPLTLKTNVSFEGLKEALEELWKLKAVDKIVVKWRDFQFGDTHVTEVTDDNWAEIVQSLYERGGNDTLEFNVQEVSDGHKTEGVTSA